ncbi:MAG: hypothetical protein Q9217_000881 [Psora testacea]
MAEPEVRIASSAPEESGDIEMQGDGHAEVPETGADDAPGEADEEAMQAEEPASRATFVEHASMSHFSSLLITSPYFASAIAPDSAHPNTTIDLATEDLEATAAVLEYLYTGEYFPHRLSSTALQSHPSIPPIDHTGDQLLKHAKIYTLAEKLGMPQLRTLAHSKIHLVNSNAVAELAYARYVYSHTSKNDKTIRKPVASFWGQRSHVLRHESEGTFKEMCLQYPEFGFDVLSFVLDAEEKREERKRKSMATDEVVPASTRKRTRG